MCINTAWHDAPAGASTPPNLNTAGYQKLSFFAGLPFNSPRLTGSDGFFLALTVGVGVFGCLVAQNHRHVIGMAVHDGFLADPVVDTQPPHLVVLELDLVVFRVNLDRVLSAGGGRDQSKRQ